MIGILLALNLAAALIYLVKNSRRRPSAVLFFLLFLAVPVLGLLLYYLPILSFRLLHKKNLYEAEDLILAGGEDSYIERPNLEEEMNMVPVSEALAVNGAEEKRSFVLNIIKKDMESNYKTILPALRDSDSEVSHYAAAAAMEIQRKQRNRLDRLEGELEEHPSGELRLELLEALQEYIDSGVVTSKDRSLSEDRYIDLMGREEYRTCRLIHAGCYLKLAEYLIDRKEYGEAEEMLLGQLRQQPSEGLYDRLLEVYYLTGQQRRFEETIEDIRSSGVTLSPDGLQRLRFFLRKE